MSTQQVYSRPVKAMIINFLGFGLAAAALAAAEKMGYLEPNVVKRGMGLIIGVLITFTGNFLPKVRPLNAPGVNPRILLSFLIGPSRQFWVVPVGGTVEISRSEHHSSA